MNPAIRNNNYHHIGTRYMPYPFLGTPMGYGYPAYGMASYPYYHPYFHQLDHYMIHLMDHQTVPHIGDPLFAEPFGGPTR
ncbi:hypothetical protein [Bacillus xiapuensis]|uniref:Spore coat protein n=1 Tax=Bacillus xiapuensis TaxID=2014075 RepID=A0ABU6N913_9BACI|nr:hypothetical protein [Bacillus xiapuensis]